MSKKMDEPLAGLNFFGSIRQREHRPIFASIVLGMRGIC
jgi:hypothetical protein